MFGKRFIRLRELTNYAVDLDLCPHPPQNGLMEFLEQHGLLTPVCRIDLPPEILRRFAQENRPYWSVPEPIEQDGSRLNSAAELMNQLNFNHWANAQFFGESVHVLDALASEHIPFIQMDFPPEAFSPWRERRVHVSDTDSGPLYSNTEQDSPSFYHYWQIFWLASILRSGLHIYYPLDDQEWERQLWYDELSTEEIRERTHRSINTEAYRELRELREYRGHFEAVGYFEAYSQNAYQFYARNHDEHGRIPNQDWRQYLRREREIASDTLSASGLDETGVVAFIGQQCEWWNNAQRVGPVAVAEEYKRNIKSTVGWLRAATGISSRRIIEAVGRRTGHFKPTLKVIFPDWTEEQRDLTIRSLTGWADVELGALPVPFPISEVELNEFCDWLEARSLFQYYWHFRRLIDLRRRDDPVYRAASTAEVASFATLCEMIANEVMKDRGIPYRGQTLGPKLRQIFDHQGPADLNEYFLPRKKAYQRKRFGHLTSTNKQTLPQRLSQIKRVKAGGTYSPVIRTLLAFMVIRNEGAHLGLLRFDHGEVIEMIRTLSMASLIIWKAR